MTDPTPRRFPLTITLGLFAVAWFVLAGPWLIGSVTIPWDAKAHWYPHLGFAARAIHSGAGLAWTPNIFTGSPEIADPQSVVFSLPLLALALLSPAPSLTAMDWATYLMLLAGGAAVILLFRDRDWHWGGALVAAIAFAFGAAAAWRVQHLGQIFSLSWFPIVWWLTSRALDRSSILYGLAAGLAGALMLIGRDQVALLFAYVLAIVVLHHWLAAPDRLKAVRASLLPLGAGAILGLAVIAMPVLMAELWGGQSNRTAIDLAGAGRGSLHPAHLLTWAIGNLYGAAGPIMQNWGPPSPLWGETDLFLARNMAVLYSGAIPLFLVLASLRTGVAFEREIRPVTIALGLAFLFALGRFTPAFQLFWHLPGIDLFRRPADAVFVIGALFAVLAGYAAHRLITRTLPTDWIVETGLVFLMVILAMMVIMIKGAPLSAWTAVITSVVALVLSLGLLTAARHIKGTLLSLALAAVLVQDLAFTNGPSESTALPLSTYEVLTPTSRNATLEAVRSRVVQTDTRRDRVEILGLGYPWQNVAMAHGLEDVLGFNPVRSAAVAGLIGAEDIAAQTDQRRFPPAFPSYRSVLADILGLRFIVTSKPVAEIDKALPPAALTLVQRTDEAFIYENTRAMPRVWIARIAEQTPADLATAGYRLDLDPATVVQLEGPLPAPRASGGTARIVTYGNSGVTIETETAEGGVLVLADAWHPWWRASVNGTEAPVRRAYGIVRAVEVPAGKATVRFSFEPVRGALAEVLGR